MKKGRLALADKWHYLGLLLWQVGSWDEGVKTTGSSEASHILARTKIWLNYKQMCMLPRPTDLLTSRGKGQGIWFFFLNCHFIWCAAYFIALCLFPNSWIGNASCTQHKHPEVLWCILMKVFWDLLKRHAIRGLSIDHKTIWGFHVKNNGIITDVKPKKAYLFM